MASLILTAQVGSFAASPVVTTSSNTVEKPVKIETIAPIAPAPLASSEAVEQIKQDSIVKTIVKIAEDNGVNPNRAIAIAKCESRLRQYDKNGKILRGEVTPEDVGVFQINEKYHLEKSKSLGYDIYTPEGNVSYAVWLLKNEGAQHWNWSRKCWQG